MFSKEREIIGIDLGSGWAKAVVLRLREEGPLVREYAMVPSEPGDSRKALEETLRKLFRQLRSKSSECAVTFWPNGAKMRFFDRGTPEAAKSLARATAGEIESLFHEELKDYVAVGGPVEGCHTDFQSSMGVAEAVPKIAVAEVESALRKLGRRLRVLQLAPLALLNSFSTSCAEIARDHSYVVTDFGRERALILAGFRGVARVARVVEFPWELIKTQVVDDAGAVDPVAREQGAEAMQNLFKELVDVCDFLDAQDQQTRLSRMHVSGALSNNAEVMRSLGEALEVQCVTWNPLQSIEMERLAKSAPGLSEDLPRLPLAAGVALQCAA